MSSSSAAAVQAVDTAVDGQPAAPALSLVRDVEPPPGLAPHPAPHPAGRPDVVRGRFHLHEAIPSRYLRRDATAIVYLPPGYDDEPERRYPVLYMHDGQNLFDDATAFAGAWRVDQAADAAITAGEVEPLIVVGIYNTGPGRMDDYTPTRDRRHRAGGKANRHGRFLVEELKPSIDRTYRTRPDPASTGLGGSSLGGLVSLYLGLQYSALFWRLAVLSPSVWWDNRFILRRVRSVSERPPHRIWLSTGTHEAPGHVENMRALRDLLVQKGWAVGEDLHYHEADGAGHSESAWAELVRPMLRHLFPATPS